MGVIKYFEIVGEVIESSIDALARNRGIPLAEAKDKVAKYIQMNSKEWRSGQQPKINYSDPFCRIAYLYHIVPANANLIESVFDDNDLMDYLYCTQHEKGEVNVCSFGGGPGTELLGLSKLIELRYPADGLVALNFLNLDRVSEWSDTWYALRDSIKKRFSSSYGDRTQWPLLPLSADFTSVDITCAERFGNLGTLFANRDIVILSYIISEVFEQTEGLEDFIVNLAKCTPSGARYVFIDRRGERWTNIVENIAERANIQLDSIGSIEGKMSGDEDKSDIGSIRADVQWDPRVTWKAFKAVGTKR